MRALVLTALLLALAPQAANALEAPIPPAPTRWVTDQVSFLSPAARARVDARLESYERSTGHQVVVWIGGTIGDMPLDDWAVRTFASWKLGRKGKDDGIAVFVLAGDRKIDIEVGYGLEGQVPDAIAARVIQEMAPRIRAGDRDGAVAGGVEALLTAIEGRPFPGGDAPQAVSGSAPERAPATLLQKIFMGLAALVLLVLFITNPRLAMLLLWSIMSGGRNDRGGGGGFQGGGGRSGGGGARGGW